MSHQTGIRANEALRTFFGRCREGDVRVLKVSIEHEELCLDEYRESIGSWEEDYGRYVPELLEENQPAYVLFRLDTQNETGYEWVLISWSPDNSAVREKMLYASTKATLKLEFGGNHIKQELFGTIPEDVTLNGYRKHCRAAKVPAPLTFAEEELLMIKKSEASADFGVDSKHQTIQGVAFPISEKAITSLYDLRDGLVNYVQLSIDLEREEINFEAAMVTDVRGLPRQVPDDEARYHLFRFDHSYEGDFLQSIIFIHSMPGYNCSIKERMLYSSCKNPLLDVVENKIGVVVAKKLQVESGRELTGDFLRDELHPKVNIHRQQFAKPKGPPSRGARRITKPPSQQDSSEAVYV